MARVSQEVRERYNKKVYDKITFRTRKDDLPADRIQQAAKDRGMSLNAFIINALKKEMGIEASDDK